MTGSSLELRANVTVGSFQRTLNDALRSLVRYMSLTLGSEWEVRLWDEDGSFKPPFARVTKAGASLYSGRPVYADVVQTMAIHCYPIPANTVEGSILGAQSVEDALYRGFRVGVGAGRPMRVPLYNYSNVPLDGTIARSDARGKHDYLRVLDFSTNRLHDPQDDRWISVVADVRVTWRREGRIVAGKTVESLKTEFAV